MSVALTSRHSHLTQHSPNNLQRDVQTATIPEPNSHIRGTYLASQPSELSFTKKCSKKCAHALVGEIKCAKCLDVLTNSSNSCRKPRPVSGQCQASVRPVSGQCQASVDAGAKRVKKSQLLFSTQQCLVLYNTVSYSALDAQE